MNERLDQDAAFRQKLKKATPLLLELQSIFTETIIIVSSASVRTGGCLSKSFYSGHPLACKYLLQNEALTTAVLDQKIANIVADRRLRESGSTDEGDGDVPA